VQLHTPVTSFIASARQYSFSICPGGNALSAPNLQIKHWCQVYLRYVQQSWYVETVITVQQPNDSNRKSDSGTIENCKTETSYGPRRKLQWAEQVRVQVAGRAISSPGRLAATKRSQRGPVQAYRLPQYHTTQREYLLKPCPNSTLI
jgi:hypothetical protein